MQKNLVMSKKSSTFALAFDRTNYIDGAQRGKIVNRQIVNAFASIAQLVEH